MGVQELANAAYLSGFLCSELLRVAPYCVPGGIRVISTAPFSGRRAPLSQISLRHRSRNHAEDLALRRTVGSESAQAADHRSSLITSRSSAAVHENKSEPCPAPVSGSKYS